MAVKCKKRKKENLKEMYEKSIKIKCCFCDIKETCKFKSYKEHSESLGIKTYCSVTPNKTKKFLKSKKANKER